MSQERIYKNYQNIEFRPHSFTQYLLSSEVGFFKCEILSIPPHPSKGFQRPIHLFTKAGPSHDSLDNFVKNATKKRQEEDGEKRGLEQKERQDEKRSRPEQERKDEERRKSEEERKNEERKNLENPT